MLMKLAAKVAVVVGGYVAAFGIAAAVVSLNVALSHRTANQASSGMVAFGDTLLFLGVFGLVSIVPTGAGLFFLRPYRPFWRLLSAAAVLIAVTGLAAVGLDALQRSAAGDSWLQAWSGGAVLRMLVAPLCGLAFLTSGLLAPSRSCRLVLLGTTLVEMAIFVYVVSTWWHQSGAL
jgi:hypothetical protein